MLCLGRLFARRGRLLVGVTWVAGRATCGLPFNETLWRKSSGLFRHNAGCLSSAHGQMRCVAVDEAGVRTALHLQRSLLSCAQSRALFFLDFVLSRPGLTVRTNLLRAATLTFSVTSLSIRRCSVDEVLRRAHLDEFNFFLLRHVRPIHVQTDTVVEIYRLGVVGADVKVEMGWVLAEQIL